MISTGRIIFLEFIILAMTGFCFFAINKSDAFLWSGLVLGIVAFFFVLAEVDQVFIKNINKWRGREA